MAYASQIASCCWAREVKSNDLNVIRQSLRVGTAGACEGADRNQGVGHGFIAAQPMGSRVGQADDAGGAALTGVKYAKKAWWWHARTGIRCVHLAASQSLPSAIRSISCTSRVCFEV